MKLRIISVGTKCPGWVRQGFDEYAKRMPREMPLSLLEIPAPRHHQDSNKVDEVEGKKIAEKSFDSKALAQALDGWRDLGKDVVFLIGGANGLSDALLDRANQRISLSALTFPHYLVRVLIAEALYRAHSICIGHPYHRD
jgi:23S rRNA (pseudouridine1915-N3)-methyltransferase